MNAPLKFAAVLLALSAIATPALADGRDHGRGHDRGGWHSDDGDRYRGPRSDDGRDHGDRRYGDRDGRGRYGDYNGNGRYDRRDAYRDGYHDGYRDDRRYDRGRVVYRTAPRYYVAPRPVYYGSYHRGPPPWARGVRYYDRGYGPTYVVNDYYGYGLRRPPHGYYWRRSDAGDFLLVALTTGIIADLVLRH